MQSTRGPTPYTFYRGQMDATLVRPIGEEATDNFQRFASAEAGPVFRRFEAASDPAELLALSRKLQEIYVENAPSLPLFASPLWGVFNTAQAIGAQAIGAQAIKAQGIGGLAVGALAVGALAIGALALGRLIIRRLEIRRARLGVVEIDELRVRRLHVRELVVDDRR